MNVLGVLVFLYGSACTRTLLKAMTHLGFGHLIFDVLDLAGQRVLRTTGLMVKHTFWAVVMLGKSDSEYSSARCGGFYKLVCKLNVKEVWRHEWRLALEV